MRLGPAAFLEDGLAFFCCSIGGSLLGCVLDFIPAKLSFRGGSCVMSDLSGAGTFFVFLVLLLATIEEAAILASDTVWTVFVTP